MCKHTVQYSLRIILRKGKIYAKGIKPCIPFPFFLSGCPPFIHPSRSAERAAAAAQVLTQQPRMSRLAALGQTGLMNSLMKTGERGIDGGENRADCDGWQGLKVVLHGRLSNSWTTYGYGLSRTQIFLSQHTVVLKRRWRRDLKPSPRACGN